MMPTLPRRPLGRTGLEVSMIGMGLEHLAPDAIAPVVRAALDRSINYFDMMYYTAAPEEALGRALQGRRGEVVLAGHLGACEWHGQYRRSRDVAECEREWNALLARLGTDCVDVCHLHYLDTVSEYEQLKQPGGIIDLAKRLQRAGKARFIGLSGHNPQAPLAAIADGVIDVTMQSVFLLDALDEERQQLYRTCAEQGVGLVGMKPFAGGGVFQWGQGVTNLQCLHYALSQPGMACVTAGVKTIAELDDNLRYLTAGAAEKEYAPVVGYLQQGVHMHCTYCNHCGPCPEAVPISTILRMLLLAEHGYGAELWHDYAGLPVKASGCVECLACMERCPYEVDIVALMHKAVEVFEEHGPPQS